MSSNKPRCSTTVTNKTTTKSSKDKLLDNEMRPFKNRGFHDGYDKGKSAVLQDAFDSGYKKAFEQNFILSTLKGVASALRTSYKNNNNDDSSTTSYQQTSQHQQRKRHSTHLISRPNSAISEASTPSTISSASSAATTPHSTIGRRNHHRLSADPATLCSTDKQTSASPSPSASSFLSSMSSASSPMPKIRHHHRHSLHVDQRRTSTPMKSAGKGGGGGDDGGGGGADNASTCSSNSSRSSSSTMASSNVTGFSSNSLSVNISSNHLSLLDSMKFDGSSDIESIKKDLITICRENRLEILAHYVSQIG